MRNCSSPENTTEGSFLVMFYRSELHFLCDTFKKCRVPARVTLLDAPIGQLTDTRLLPFLDEGTTSKPLSSMVGDIDGRTIYRYTDIFRMKHIFILLPDRESPSVLVIGPYCSHAFSEESLLELLENLNIPVKNRSFFGEYLSSIPVLEESSPLFSMLDTFAEYIWGGESFSYIDAEQERHLPDSPLNKTGEDEELEQALANIRRLEMRYEYENELMTAVSQGQVQKVNALIASLSSISLDRRTSDQQRNIKNYCIVMNTLLRKAAEQGGVHPVYLDKVSSAFAVQIEETKHTDELSNLMAKMFHDYCRLVRKHALGAYSPVVQKTIIFIESDLSASLSLSTLATAQKVSPGYLSAVFKKETGKTLTEYITRKRMKHAAHLLTTTHLQVQTIAMHCGILDVQYFSKLFKKYAGMSPLEYRQSHL